VSDGDRSLFYWRFADSVQVADTDVGDKVNGLQLLVGASDVFGFLGVISVSWCKFNQFRC